MSKSVDERIVDMQFNNQQFESGIKNSISSLDKLKKSLDLEGASRGLSRLDETAKKFSLAGIAEGVDSIASKFTAMGVVGITAIANIANSAVNAGKRIVSALTIDPITMGFREYETQINAVQTILANTASKGTTLNQVNAALEELNLYADKTIYNFTEMTRNIGTFTAAGTDLKTSVAAIKGIANLAAISGSNAQQASVAMYQLSQALASGTVKLMDWNSVVNAGMGGQVFQDALKETARLHGVAIDQMIKSEGSFRETLQKGWLTSEVLTETLAKFTGDLNESQLRTMGYTEAQIVEIIKLGQMANDAATKVKTFTQLYDTLKEAAQSGWSQTWKIVIGDFGEAKELLTEMSTIIGGVITASANARNSLLTGGLSTGWKQLLSAGIADETGYVDALTAVAKDHGVTIDEMIAKEGSFTATLKSGWLTADMMGEALANLTNKTKGLTNEQLTELGYTRAQIDALESFNESVQNGSVSLEEFSKKMTMASGRENLVQALRNSFEGLVSVLKPIGEAFREIFPAATGEQLYALTEKIRDFTAQFKLTDTQLQDIKSTFKGFFAILDIGKTIFTTLAKGLITLIKAVLPVGDGVLHVTGTIGEFFVSLDEAIKKIGIFDAVFETLGKVVRSISDFVKIAIFGVVDSFKMFASDDSIDKVQKRFEPLAKIGEFVSNVFSKMSESLGKLAPFFLKLGEVIGNAFGALQDKISESLTNFNFDGLFDLLNGGLFAAILLGLKKLIGSFSSITDSVGGTLGGIKGILDGVKGSLEAYQNSLNAKVLLQIAISIGILAAALLVLSTIDSKKLTSSLAAMTAMFVQLFGSMAIFSKTMSGSGFRGILKISTSMIAISIAILILASAMKKLADISWEGIAKGLVSIGALLAGLGVFVNMVGGEKRIFAISAGMVLLGASMLLFAKAIEMMGNLSWEQIGKGLLTMALALAAITVALNFMPPTTIVSAAGLLVISAALVILAGALKIMASMSIAEVGKSLLALAGSLAIIAVAVTAMLAALPGAAALIVISVSLVILAGALKIMGSMSIEEIGKALLVLAGSLAIIAVAMNFMITALPGAAALLVISAALVILSGALKVLGSMSLAEIGKSLLALVGVFAVLGVAGLLLAPLTPVLLALGAAIALLGVGCMAVGVGLLAFSTGLAALAVSGAAGAAALVIVITSIIGLIPMFLKQVGVGIVALAGVIAQGAPAIAAAMTAVMLAIIQSITTVIPEAVNAIMVLLTSTLQAIASYTPQMVQAGMDILIGFLEGIANNIERAVEAGIDIVLNFIQGIADKIPDVIQAGVDLVLSFINGTADAIRNNTDAMIAAMQNLITAMLESAVKVITAPAKGAFDIGKNIVDGIINGIKNGVGAAIDAAKNLGSNIYNAVKDFFVIKSPSRLMRDEVGNYIPEGIAEGIKRNMSAEEAATKKAENIVNAFKSAFAKADLRSSTADLEYKLWTALNGKNASETDKATQELYMLSQKVQAQQENVNLAQSQYQAMVKNLGVDSNDTKKAYNDYLQEQIELAELVSQLNEAQKNASTTTGDAMTEYAKWMAANLDMLLKQGFTREQIEEAARKATGYGSTPTTQSGQTPLMTAMTTDVTKSVTAAMASVKTAFDNQAEQTFNGLLASFTKWGKSYAEALGTGFLTAFKVVMTQIKTALNSMETEIDLRVMSLASRVQAVLDGEANPTIKPVLDLTDIKSGAATVSSLLGGNRVLNVAGVAARAASIGPGSPNSNSGNPATDVKTPTASTFAFTQNNYSPKPLSRLEIYRQTKNQFSELEGLVNG